MNRIKLSYSLFFFSLLMACSHKKVEIRSFPMFNYVDSSKPPGRIYLIRNDNFLVYDYNDSKQTETIIDSFAKNNIPKDLEKYGAYSMSFFKESTITNPQHLKENPRDLDRYSHDHDLLYEYKWSSGKFSQKYKYKNGQIVSPFYEIKITDIPNRDSSNTIK